MRNKDIVCASFIKRRKNQRNSLLKRMYTMRHYYVLLLPTIAFFIIFHYFPMYGITIAFKNYTFAGGILGSEWVGFKQFQRLFESPLFYNVIENTVVISLLRIAVGFPAPIVFALLLNEISNRKFKRVVQTISYLPHFISWVILAGIIKEILSPSRGAVNYLLGLFGADPVYFLAEPSYFRAVLIISGVWQSVGWGSIIYLASIAGINVEQYDAAYIDGANRFQVVRYITLPSLRPVISIVFILNLGQILNAGFDQIFNLYNTMVYSVADVIDTYVYRIGLVNMEYSFSTAVGLFKNVIGFVLVIVGNYTIRKFSGGEAGLW